MKNRIKTVLLLSSLGVLALTSCKPDTPIQESESLSESQPIEEKKYSIVDDGEDHVYAVGLPSEAKAGETITFSLSLEPGYEYLGKLPLVTSAGQEVPLVKNEDGSYSFVMPAGDVKITESARKAVYGLSTEVGGNLKVTAYKTVPMKEIYQEECQNVAGTYEGVFTFGSNGNDYVRLILRGDGSFRMSRYAKLSGVDNSGYISEGSFSVSKGTDEDGNEAALISGPRTKGISIIPSSSSTKRSPKGLRLRSL